MELINHNSNVAVFSMVAALLARALCAIPHLEPDYLPCIPLDSSPFQQSSTIQSLRSNVLSGSLERSIHTHTKTSANVIVPKICRVSPGSVRS